MKKIFLMVSLLMMASIFAVSANGSKNIGAELDAVLLVYSLDMGLDGGALDANRDGKLSADEAAAATRINLGFTNKTYGGKLTSLRGLEYFTGLERLDCSFNKLTSLDLRAQTKLKQLTCYHNLLKSIDLSNCTKLTEIFCHNNLLESLDFSAAPDMMHIYALNNPELKSVDIRNCTPATLITFDCKGGTKKLDTIYVNSSFDADALPKYWRWENASKVNYIKAE